jgi:hypothetical protein
VEKTVISPIVGSPVYADPGGPTGVLPNALLNNATIVQSEENAKAYAHACEESYAQP